MTITKTMNILITGANGFIGRNLCGFLKEKGHLIRAAVRNNVHAISGVDEYIQVGDINELTNWQQALEGVDAVVHLAARVHITRDIVVNSLDAFRKVNVLGTERLARMAVKAGVKRFIFISSVKVNGEGTGGRRQRSEVGSQKSEGGGRKIVNRDGWMNWMNGWKTEGMDSRSQKAEVGGQESELKEAFSERSIPDPQDAYGVSKLEAENILKKIADETGLQTVILRLPLVYGLGVKANFKNLIKLAGSGLPLPFKSVNNRRSFIYLGNLVDVISTCITHPKAAGETFMVSDGQDISTPDLIRMIASAMDKKPILFSLHPGILKALCKIAGKGKELEKLTGSLLVDSSKIRNLLGWKPPFTLEEGIRHCCIIATAPDYNDLRKITPIK